VILSDETTELRTDSLVAEALLGQTDALDAYALEKQGGPTPGTAEPNVQKWRSRDNRFEIWLIGPMFSTAPPPEDPAVEEARNYAEDFGSQRRRLEQQLTDLRQAVGTREYPILKQSPRRPGSNGSRSSSSSSVSRERAGGL
jgi:hypothetical protein